MEAVPLAGETATREEAHRAAAHFVLMRISLFVRAAPPEEAEWRDGSPPVWAFKLALALPGTGFLGGVGEILVDATTGKVLDDPEWKARSEADVRERARRTAP
ncbi:MAG: hypothetical protein K2W96_00430 [Gemmataceae bacterium]|nr:hypothetical protein [Gemmataceae bacterium]